MWCKLVGSSGSRPVVRVTDNDLLASMQILACIARPHRVSSAGEILQQWSWARRRLRLIEDELVDGMDIGEMA